MIDPVKDLIEICLIIISVCAIMTTYSIWSIYKMFRREHEEFDHDMTTDSEYKKDFCPNCFCEECLEQR